MKSYCEKVLDVLSQSQEMFIPVYQRGYSWTKDQVYELFTDLVSNGGNGKCLYLGNVIFSKEEDTQFKDAKIGDIVPYTEDINSVAIVDGQQRTITLAMLIHFLQQKESVLESVNKEDAEVFREFSNLIQDVHITVNSSDADAFEYYMTPSHDYAPVVELNMYCTLAETGKYTMTLVESSSTEDCVKAIKALMKSNVSVLELDPVVDDIQGVMSSINSTGKQLADFDLIKNLSLMNVPISKQAKVYEDSWKVIIDDAAKSGIAPEELLRRIMASEGLLPNSEQYSRLDLLRAYKSAQAKFGNRIDLESSINKYYATMGKIKQYPFSEETNTIIASLRSLPSNSIEVIILTMQMAVINRHLTEEDVQTVLKVIETFVIRMRIAGYGYSKIFSTHIAVAMKKLELPNLVSTLSDFNKSSRFSEQGELSELDGQSAPQRKLTLGELTLGYAPEDTRVDDFVYTLFYSDKTTKYKLGTFSESLKSIKNSDLDIVEFILHACEIKNARKEVVFEGSHLSNCIPSPTAAWCSWFVSKAESIQPFFDRFFRSISNFLLIDEDIEFDNEGPETIFDKLHKSKYGLTRGFKKLGEITSATMEDRETKIISVCEKLWAMPKLDLKAMMRNSKNSWIEVPDLTSIRGVKPTAIRINDDELPLEDVKKNTKTWKMISWFTIKSIFDSSTEIDGTPILEVIKNMAKEPDFEVDGLRIFTSKRGLLKKCEGSTNVQEVIKNYVQIMPDAYLLAVSNSDKNFLVLQKVCSEMEKAGIRVYFKFS